MPSFYIDNDFISFFNIAHECVGGKSYNTHDDAMEWKHSRVTGHLCGEGEFTGHR